MRYIKARPHGTPHVIDFDAAKVIDKGNFRTRKTLESWHTALSDQANNNSKPLPGQYIMLTKIIKHHIFIL
jgi:hypothetical protein